MSYQGNAWVNFRSWCKRAAVQGIRMWRGTALLWRASSVAHCSSFLSVAGMQHSDQKQLRGAKGLCCLSGSSPSRGRGEPGQKHEAETMGQHCSFACAGSGLSNFLTQRPAYLLRDGCHPQWASLSYISEPLRQFSTERPTGQSDRGSSSIETYLFGDSKLCQVGNKR